MIEIHATLWCLALGIKHALVSLLEHPIKHAFIPYNLFFSPIFFKIWEVSAVQHMKYRF